MSSQIFKSLNKALQSPDQVKILMLKLQKEERVPETISKFINLEEIYIQGDNIVDSHLDVSPTVKHIALNSTKLSQLDPTIFNLPNLQILNLKACNLTTLPKITKINNCIKTIYLNNNVIEQLDGSIEFLQGLSTLFLNCNKLRSLPPEFVKLKNLTRLNLDHNQFEILPECLFKMNNIKHLSLDQNQFTEDEKLNISEKLSIWF